jgi:hypothetical protein
VTYEYREGKNVLDLENNSPRGLMRLASAWKGCGRGRSDGRFVASSAEQFKAQMAGLTEKNFLFVVLNLDR